MKRSSAQSNLTPRWKIESECKNLHADILSARCIVDRLRLQSGPAAVAESADRMEFRKISSNLAVIVKFVRSVEDVLDPEAAIENGEPS